MKTRLVGLVSLILLTAISLGASQKHNPREIVKERWVLNAIKQLKKDGVFVDYPEGVFPKELSRFEYGIRVHATTQWLKGMTEEAEKCTEYLEAKAVQHKTLATSKSKALSMPTELADLGKWRKDTDILLRLTTEFAVEIKMFDGDPVKMEQEIRESQKQLDYLQPKAILAIAGTTWLLDLPQTHFVYAALREFRMNDLVSNRPFTWGEHQRPSRADLTDYLVTGCENLIKWSEKTEAEIKSLKQKTQASPEDSEFPVLIAKLGELSSTLDTLEDLSRKLRSINRTIDFFEVELKAMGKDPAEMKNRLREAL